TGALLLDGNTLNYFGKIFLPDGLLDRYQAFELIHARKPEDFEKYQAFELIHAR
uniref:Chlorophyll a-b binding protein 1, chloroplastic (Fragments) n=1 Tax=Populus euphratica TaxID=75702 RepID=CB21_POPEU|nr:RecName: Full=Chlorophyll a-b binding protein 1, chloroplastic; AltName: Full=LHCII type I CAB-1; Short=LHCP [Populus euphratica]